MKTKKLTKAVAERYGQPQRVITLKLHIKVCDRFECDIVDKDGVKIVEYEGYVPEFFPGKHYGDYLLLDIDIDTGRITNWIPPTLQGLEEFIAKKED